jgi:hypothetical protein
MSDHLRDEMNRLVDESVRIHRRLFMLRTVDKVPLERHNATRLATSADYLDGARFPETNPRYPATVEQDMARREAKLEAAE